MLIKEEENAQRMYLVNNITKSIICDDEREEIRGEERREVGYEYSYYEVFTN